MKIQERRITLRGDVSILLKSAGPADAWRLWKHRYETSGETYYLACEQEEMEFFREAEEERLQATETDTREFDVSAFADGVLIGSASVRYVRRHRKFLHRAHFGISIREAYCGLGLGRRMIETALEQAAKNGFEQMELGVFSDNERAIHLYESCRFQKTGVLPRAYKLKDGSYRDEIQMVCNLVDEKPAESASEK